MIAKDGKRVKRTKAYLEAENQYLWYWHIYHDSRARFIKIEERDRRGVIVHRSSSFLPPKKYWLKHPLDNK